MESLISIIVTALNLFFFPLGLFMFSMTMSAWWLLVALDGALFSWVFTVSMERRKKG